MSDHFKYSLIGKQIVKLEDLIANSVLNTYGNLLVLSRKIALVISQLARSYYMEKSQKIMLILILLGILVRVLKYLSGTFFPINREIHWDRMAFFPKECLNQDRLKVLYLFNSKLSLDNISRYESFVKQNAVARKKLGYRAENFNSPFFKIFHNIILNAKLEE